MQIYSWKANSFYGALLLCCFLVHGRMGYTQEVSKDSKKAASEVKKVKGKEGKFKKDLKKIEKLLSFKNFFHHDDSTKLAKQYVHQQHQLTKGKSDYPYNVNHKDLGLKLVPYKKTTEFRLDYEVLGWYPYWEKDLHKSLNYSLLTTVAYFSYELNPSTGKATSIYDWSTTPLIDSARNNGTKVLLTVTNFGETNNKNFLTNDDAIETFIGELLSLLKGRGHGVCLDFEGVANGQKDDYAKFIVLLSQRLKEANKNYLIYMTVPAVDWAKSLEFQALIPVVDQFVIMGYGYYGSTSKVAGPGDLLNSGKTWEPYNLSVSVDYYLANQVPDSMLILALPYYGVMWNTENANMGSKITDFIGNRTYDYIRSKIAAPIQYDTISQTAWCSYVVNSGGKKLFRQCWFDNDSTLGVKLNFIKSRKLKGMGIWALGYDKGYVELWDVIAREMCNTKVIAEDGVVDTSSDSEHADSSGVSTSASQFWSKLTNIEGMLQEITNYKTILLMTMTFVVLFGGTGFVIAMFQPNTRMFFFGSTAYTIYYTAFVLLFLMVILRMTNIIDDDSIILLLGFISGAVALYIINKIVQRIKRNVP